jgi:transcriptional regulator with XRE-family HTH domain
MRTCRMTAQGGGPGTTVVRRQLGRRLRRLREEAGKSHDDIQAAQIAGRTKMWKLEHGLIPVREGDVLALARLYGLDSGLTEALVRLAAGTRDRGWTEEFGRGVPEGFGLYAGLEASSSAVTMWHSELVPGLLQTEDYCRALMIGFGGFNTDELTSRVAFRMERQRMVLERETPGKVRAVLGAGALLLHIGSDLVMEAQRAHLRALSTRPSVEIRVLPWSAGAHPATKGAFTLLDFDDPDDPALVFVETHLGARYLERSEQVAEYRRIFDVVYGLARPIEEFTV